MDKNGSDEIKNSEKNDAIEIKIRRMFCRQTQTLRIDKRVGVGALKEEVTLVTGVLAEHQRLIFHGKALSDDKQLSDYRVEDGDTLHLIVTTTSDPQESSSDEFNNRASNLSQQLPLITQMVSALLLSIANAAENAESVQATVSRSSSEAEYRALASTRTKHIEIDCHVVRQKVHEGVIKLLSIPSHKQIADGFTKALAKPLFDNFHDKLGLQDLHAPAYGDSSSAPPSPSLSAAEAALERELHRAAFVNIYAMLDVRGLDEHRRAVRSFRERIASRNVGNVSLGNSNTSAQLPMPMSAMLVVISIYAAVLLISMYAILVVISYDLVDAHRWAARSIRERSASRNVGNRGSSSSSRDQPAPAASLMNHPHPGTNLLMNVSLGNSAQPNATAAAPPGNSIEETNDAVEDTSKDDGGSPDV
nr:uncharacterized protein LOC109174442 [Ipomoea batatas]